MLPPTLVLDTLTVAPPEEDRDADVNTELRCEIGTGHPGRHADAVRLLYHSSPSTVWAQWSDGGAPQSVIILPDCLEHNGEPPGKDDACCLFVGHPGACSFDLFDPEHEAFLSANPAYWYLYRRGNADSPTD